MCYNGYRWLVKAGLLSALQGVMCMSLYEKLSLMLAAATLAVNIIFLITR